MENRKTMICRGRFAYYPEISEPSAQRACGRCSYPVEKLPRSNCGQRNWLRGRSQHRQGTGRRGQCLYPRLWSDVGATYSFDKEGEDARILVGMSDAEYQRDGENAQTHITLRKGSGQYAFINDSFNAQKGKPTLLQKWRRRLSELRCND